MQIARRSSQWHLVPGLRGRNVYISFQGNIVRYLHVIQGIGVKSRKPTTRAQSEYGLKLSKTNKGSHRWHLETRGYVDLSCAVGRSRASRLGSLSVARYVRLNTGLYLEHLISFRHSGSGKFVGTKNIRDVLLTKSESRHH